MLFFAFEGFFFVWMSLDSLGLLGGTLRDDFIARCNGNRSTDKCFKESFKSVKLAARFLFRTAQLESDLPSQHTQNSLKFHPFESNFPFTAPITYRLTWLASLDVCSSTQTFGLSFITEPSIPQLVRTLQFEMSSMPSVPFLTFYCSTSPPSEDPSLFLL